MARNAAHKKPKPAKRAPRALAVSAGRADGDGALRRDIVPVRAYAASLRRPLPDSWSVDDELSNIREELSLARAEVEAERYRYRDLFDQAPDGYVVTTRVGSIEEANVAASGLLGVLPRFLVGKPLPVFIALADRARLRDSITSMARHERSQTVVRLTPRDRESRVAHLSAAAVRDRIGGPLRGIRWILRDVTDQVRNEQDLAAGREKLRELASELAMAEERVRREIATGIHDRVSQPLALAKMLLGQIRLAGIPKQAKLIGELNAMLQQAIDESRTLTFELSPPVLYELGLAPAIDWLAEQVQRRHGLKVQLEGHPYEGPIADARRVLLFQAVRELLTNVVKHAKATVVRIGLHLEEADLVVTVSDNGSGKPPPAAEQRQRESGGFGLFSIRTRVERLGGSLQLLSRPGHGTRATLRLPLEDAPAVAPPPPN